MRNWTWKTMFAAAALAVMTLPLAPPAHADARARLDLDQLVIQAFVLLQYAEYGAWREDQLKDADPKACRAALAGFKKKGIKDSDTLSHSGFKAHPKAEPADGSYRIRFADAGWVCDQLAAERERQGFLVPIAAGLQLEQWMTLVKPEDAGSVKGQLVPKAEGCVKAIDAALAAGVSDTTKVRGPAGEVTMAEARPRCVKLVEAAKEFEAKVTGREEEKRKKALAKYQAVGIKGKRLELFAYYDNIEWYYAGCQSSTDDPKKLKAAKALFQWLTDSNGVITIRKYSFSGDNYKVSEKTFYTERAAYKGCR
jgi:hypothetical protein